MVSQALASSRFIHRFEAGREGLRLPGLAQRQHLVATQEGFNGSAEPGPELNLARDRSLRGFTHEAGVQNQRVGDLHWLTHGPRVAKCYRLSIGSEERSELRGCLHAQEWLQLPSRTMPHASEGKLAARNAEVLKEARAEIEN